MKTGFTLQTADAHIQEEERMERVARGLIDVLRLNLDKNLVEHSERTSCFKVRSSDQGWLGCVNYVNNGFIKKW